MGDENIIECENYLQVIADFFNLGKIISFSEINMGLVNTSWKLITQKGSYVVRKLPSYKTIEELQTEQSIILSLDDSEFSYSLPTPISSFQGEIFFEENNALIWVYEYIEGEVYESLDAFSLEEIAYMFQELHSLPTPSNHQTLKNNLLTKESVMAGLDSAFLVSKEKTDSASKLVQKSYSSFKKFLELITLSSDSIAIIHADITSENILFKEGHLSAILDFEHAGVGSPIEDITVFLQRECSFNNQLDFTKISAFMKIYCENKLFKKEGAQLFFSYALLHYIDDFCYFYWVLQNEPERDVSFEHLEQTANIINWSVENKSKIVDFFREFCE